MFMTNLTCHQTGRIHPSASNQEKYSKYCKILVIRKNIQTLGQSLLCHAQSTQSWSATNCQLSKQSTLKFMFLCCRLKRRHVVERSPLQENRKKSPSTPVAAGKQASTHMAPELESRTFQNRRVHHLPDGATDQRLTSPVASSSLGMLLSSSSLLASSVVLLLSFTGTTVNLLGIFKPRGSGLSHSFVCLCLFLHHQLSVLFLFHVDVQSRFQTTGLTSDFLFLSVGFRCAPM